MVVEHTSQPRVLTVCWFGCPRHTRTELGGAAGAGGGLVDDDEMEEDDGLFHHAETPSSLKQLRACLSCHLVKTQQQVCPQLSAACKLN